MSDEIAEIKKDVGDIKISLASLRMSYAELAERVKHPCPLHGALADRVSHIEGNRTGSRNATGLWLIGISAMLASATAIIVAVLKQ